MITDIEAKATADATAAAPHDQVARTRVLRELVPIREKKRLCSDPLTQAALALCCKKLKVFKP
jgi:hypothetical protein